MQSWSGLITNASPFALPPGAAVEQVNLVTYVPGQISARGGMAKASFVGSAPSVLDCYPYEQNGKTYLLALTGAGQLVALESPAYGTSSVPRTPPLVSSAETVATAYTFDFADQDGTTVVDVLDEEGVQSVSLDGGEAATTDYMHHVDASISCGIAGEIDAWDGGDATDGPYDLLLEDALCPVVYAPPMNATAPSAPTELSVTFADHAARLDWEPPASDGGSPVIDYDVQISVNGATSPASAPPQWTRPSATFSATSAVVNWGGVVITTNPAVTDFLLQKQSSTDGGITWVDLE